MIGIKKGGALLVLVIAALGLALVARQVLRRAKPPQAAPARVEVVASFYPLAEFARRVGGDRVEVIPLLPTGMEPHDYEPAPRDVIRILDSRLFIFNGSGLDPWAEKVAEELERKGIPFIDMSEHVERIHADTRAGAGHDQGGHAEAGAGSWDPHYWLDPVMAQRQVEVIADTLSGISPGDSGFFKANAQAYAASLADLDRKYRAGLSRCEKKGVIVSHAALGYLARRYGFAVTAIVESPAAEPSPRWLAEVSRMARERGIEYILFETLVSPRLAQTLAREVGARTVVFNPIEGLTREELEQGKNYLSLMEENLANLRLALKCN